MSGIGNLSSLYRSSV